MIYELLPLTSRGLKNARLDILNLCASHDIVCIQEHWLMPHDLSVF